MRRYLSVSEVIFIHQNKRIAFFSADTFLRMNGYYINCDNQKAYNFFINLFEANKFDFARLLPWLREKVDSL
jgi:prophage maintenance system killer protein